MALCSSCGKKLHGAGNLIQKDGKFFVHGQFCKICAEGLRLKHGIHKHGFEEINDVNDNYPHQTIRYKKCMVCGATKDI